MIQQENHNDQELTVNTLSSMKLDPSMSTPGEFVLPLPDSVASQVDSRPRSGAVSTSFDQLDESDDQYPRDVGAIDTNLEMPKIVWLRGDEPWFDQFDLNAQDAMEILGIKRSRLTQISGHELRVGRIRVDRYIKPVYRSKDVNAYKQWSRTTVTTQKSTQALKAAVDVLEHHANQLQDQVSKSQHQVYKAILDEASTAWREALDFKDNALRDSMRDLVENRLSVQMLLIKDTVESIVSSRIDLVLGAFKNHLEEIAIRQIEQIAEMELRLSESLKSQSKSIQQYLDEKSLEWQNAQRSWATQLNEIDTKVSRMTPSNKKTKLNANRNKRCVSGIRQTLNPSSMVASGVSTHSHGERKKPQLSKFAAKRRRRD